MNYEGVWEILSWETQVQPQIILQSRLPPDYLSVSYDYDLYEGTFILIEVHSFIT